MIPSGVCPECKLDFQWFEFLYILDKNGDPRARKAEIGCSKNKSVSNCPNYKVFERDMTIGTFLDDINKKEEVK